MSDSTLNADQAALVEASFSRVTERAEVFFARFYELLFAAAPGTRKLFKSPLEQQADKLSTSLTMVVAQLRCPDAIRPMLLELGAGHVAYGVLPAHYAVFRAVFVRTLEEAIGPGWNSQLAVAWRRALELTVDVMLEGALSIADQR